MKLKLKSDDWLGKRAFGKAIGRSAGRVTQLIAEGLPTSEDGRTIPLQGARRWYEDHIRKSARERGPKAHTPKSNPRSQGTRTRKSGGSSAERLLTAQASRAESLAVIADLEARRRKNELVELSDTERAWGNIVMAARDRFLLLPDKLAPKLLGLANLEEIRELLRLEIRDTLTALSTR